MPQTKTAGQMWLDAVANSGLKECSKCGGLFATRAHYCYTETFDAQMHALTMRSQWSLSAIVASHTGYEYTVVLNRNVSGTHGPARVAVGLGSSPTQALGRAIVEADRVDADEAVQAEDQKEREWMAQPEV